MSRIEQPKKLDEPTLRMVEHFTLPVWRSGPDAKCDYFNKTWLDFTGRTLDQELGDGWIDGVHAEDRTECLTNYLEAFHARRSFVLEYRLRRYDGEYRWVVDCGSPFDDSAGRFAGYLGVCYDITQRKLTEEALRKSEKLFVAFMDNLPGFAWMKDLEGRYTYVNDTLSQLGPYRTGALGKTDENLWPAKIARTYRENDLEVINTKKPLHLIEAYLIGEEQRTVLVSKFPIFDQDGSVVMTGGVSVDVTDRIRAEEALHAQILRYKTLMETSTDSIYVIDTNGDLQEANAEFLRKRGYSAEEAEGLNVADWDAQWTREELLKRTRELIGRNAVFETRHRRKDGFVFDVEVGLTSVRIADKQLFFCVTRDITERKKAEQARREDEERFREMVENLSRRRAQVHEDERRYLARELHDQIGQALTAAKISVQSAKRSKKRETMATQLNKATTILDQILLQVRQMALDLRPPALDDLGLMPAARLVLDDYAKRGGWRVQFAGDEDLGRPDAEVETACFRIILEALTNILRHAGAREVSMKLQKNGDSLHLLVRDDGVGFNVPDADKWIPRDCLGLVGMRERATAVGGNFEIKSMPEQGTEIHAFLPCHPG